MRAHCMIEGEPMSRAASPQLKLIALDLDGTLLRSDISVSARTRAALDAAEAAGIGSVCITARPPRRVFQIAESIGLRGVVICSNGALVYDLTQRVVLRQTLLSHEIASALIAELRARAPGICFAIEAGMRYGCEPSYEIQHAHDRVDPAMQRDDALTLAAAGVTKLIAQHPAWSLERLLELARSLAGERASATHSGSNFIELAATSVTKALALELHCTERGILPAQVIAFGDMPNDLPMLRWAGRAVAVANAHPELLALADEITLSNDEDGVAVVLERLARHGYVLEPSRRCRS
jgi:Cof subfamily protein (haloacid dehalogenase superfamily)